MTLIPEDKWNLFWTGADRRITKMGGDPERAWIERRLKTLYDMGQNLDILAEWATGFKDVNVFELPGGENCSSFIASFFGCGFDAIGWKHLAPFLEFLYVSETGDVGPGHFGMAENDFRELKSGDEIRAGCVKLSMSWSDAPGDIKKILLRTLAIFALISAPLPFFKELYTKMPGLFRDGIKVTQRDRYKIPDPWWRATHVDLIWRVSQGIAFCVGQTAFLRQYPQEIKDLYVQMSGVTPRIKVLEPTFLYGG